jgi:hypothetical protein
MSNARFGFCPVGACDVDEAHRWIETVVQRDALDVPPSLKMNGRMFVNLLISLQLFVPFRDWRIEIARIVL